MWNVSKMMVKWILFPFKAQKHSVIKWEDYELVELFILPSFNVAFTLDDIVSSLLCWSGTYINYKAPNQQLCIDSGNTFGAKKI